MRCLLASLILCLGLAGAARAEQNGGIAEFYAGHAALQSGEADAAITHFTKALQIGHLDPTQTAYVHYYRAIAYQRLDRHQEAIDGYTQALSFNVLPKRVQAALYYNRAIALDHLANFDRAIKDYSAAIAIKPDYAEAYMNRGNAYRKLNNNDLALRDYAASANYGNPIKHLPYYGQGLVYEAKGDRVEAFKAFQTALSLAPDFEPARLKVEGYQAAGMKPTLGGAAMAGANPVAPIKTAMATPMKGEGLTGATATTPTTPRPGVEWPLGLPNAGPPGGAVSPAGTSGAIASTTATATVNPSPMASATSAGRGPTAPSKAASKAAAKAAAKQAAVRDSAKIDDIRTPSGPTKPEPPPPALAPSPLATFVPTTSVPGAIPSHETTLASTAPTGAAVPGEGETGSSTAMMTAPTPLAGAEPSPLPTTAAPAKTASAGGPGRFLIQVAAYKEEAVAETEAQGIKAKVGDLLGDKSQNIQRADLGDKGIYYRIQFGAFASKAEATERCSSIKARGVPCLVVIGGRS
jgi:tetratricopeptide (TPR) repeat protein